MHAFHSKSLKSTFELWPCHQVRSFCQKTNKHKLRFLHVSKLNEPLLWGWSPSPIQEYGFGVHLKRFLWILHSEGFCLYIKNYGAQVRFFHDWIIRNIMFATLETLKDIKWRNLTFMMSRIYGNFERDKVLKQIYDMVSFYRTFLSVFIILVSFLNNCALLARWHRYFGMLLFRFPHIWFCMYDAPLYDLLVKVS